MMKTVKKLLALMLVLAFALSLTACGKSDEEKILGNWTLEFDAEPLLLYQPAAGYEADPMRVVVTAAFNEDGTVTVSYDEELYAQELEAFVTDVQATMETTCYTAIADVLGADATDSMMVEYGMTAIELYEELTGSGDATAVVELARAMNQNPYVSFDGTYVLDSEALTIVLTAAETGDVYTCTYAFTEDGGFELSAEEGVTPFGARLTLPATFMRAE